MLVVGLADNTMYARHFVVRKESYVSAIVRENHADMYIKQAFIIRKIDSLLVMLFILIFFLH